MLCGPTEGSDYHLPRSVHLVKEVELILVPYHLGHADAGMGAGPGRLLSHGAEAAAGVHGHRVSVSRVEASDPPTHEIGAAIAVNRCLARLVRQAVERDAFPLILAGNCNSCLGTLAGLGVTDIGVAWFDAHGDFNTPETSASGFFDGMALNAAVGGCWQTATRSIPGFEPAAENRVGLIGVRDLDAGERRLLDRSAVKVVEYDEICSRGVQPATAECVAAVEANTRAVYLHVDLDVLDGDMVPANEFSLPGGLTAAELDEALISIGERLDVRAAAVTAYDPSRDPEDRAAAAALRVVRRLAELGEAGKPV